MRNSSYSFARNISMLAGGAATAQLISILASPVLTRLYSPDELGAMGIFLSIVMIVNSFSSFQYQNALPIVRSSTESSNIVALCLLCLVATTVLFSVFMVLFSEPFFQLVNANQLGSYRFLIILAILLLGLFQIVRFWSLRVGLMKELATLKVVQAVAMTVIQIGAYQFNILALLVGQIVGRSSGLVKIIRRMHHHQDISFSKLSIKRICVVAKSHKRYPVFAAPGTLLNELGQQLPVLVLSSQFGVAIAGLYLLAQRALAVPMATIGVSIAEAFLSEVKARQDDGVLNQAVKQLHLTLIGISLPPVLILAIIGPDFFAYIFGEAWRDSGLIIQYLAPMFYFQFITFPLSGVMILFKRDKDRFIFQSAMLVARFVALLAGSHMGGFKGAVIAFSLVSSMCYLIYLIHILRLCSLRLKDILGYTVITLLLSLVAAIPVAFLTIVETDVLNVLVAYSLTGVIVCGHYLCIYKNLVRRN